MNAGASRSETGDEMSHEYDDGTEASERAKEAAGLPTAYDLAVNAQPLVCHPRQLVTDEEMAALGMDGKLWSEVFCKATGFPDQEWALAWFCNAIMAGYDEAHRRAQHGSVDQWARHEDDCGAAAWEQRMRHHVPNYPRPACTCGLDAAFAQRPPQTTS